MAADYSAVCLAIALKFDLVHPVIDSTAISNGHISASGSDRAPGATSWPLTPPCRDRGNGFIGQPHTGLWHLALSEHQVHQPHYSGGPLAGGRL